jgi:hypothetical protein
VLRRSTIFKAAIVKIAGAPYQERHLDNYKYFAPTEPGLGPLNLYGSKVDFGLAFASGVVDPEGFGEA